jgi:hypothetical protein
MSLYVRYPVLGIPTYPTFSALPAIAVDGTVAITTDTDTLYAFNLGTLTWVVLSGPTAVLSVGTLDGQPPVANGASITLNSIYLQSASATFPGLVNTGSQTLAGNKTFNGSISAANLSGTNTGDVTLATVGSTPSTNGASLSGQVLTLQPADGTHAGLMTSITQTLGGNKTFTGSISASNLSGTNTGDVTIGTASGLSLSSQILSLALSNTSTTGALSSTDWNTFNNKQAALPVGTQNQLLISNGASPASWSDIPESNIIYVDKTGNDTTGTGKLNNPYLTIAKAISTITSPTTSNRFQVKVGIGTFIEATLTLKPWTWIVGSNGMLMGGDSRINVSSNAITLDSSWSAGSQRGGLTDIYLTGSTGINFDRQAISGVGSVTYEFFNVGMNGSLAVKSSNGALDFIDVFACRIFGSLTTSGGALSARNSEIYTNITIDTAGTQDFDGDLYYLYLAGNLSVTSTGSNVASLRVREVNIDGTVSTSGSGTTLTSPLDYYKATTTTNWNSIPVAINTALDTLAGSGIVKSQSQNLVLASPSGSSGVPSFRAIVAADLPSITLSGDVSGTGTTAITTTIGSNKVTNSQLAQMAAHSFKGNNTGSTANASDLTATQLTAELNQFTSSLQGVVPSSGGGTTNFLRADGSWAAPTSSPTAPTVQTFTTAGSGTYTRPTGPTPLYIKVSMVGAGGGGNGTGTSGATDGANGGNTTFGTSLLTANGGVAGTATGGGGAGGTASGGNINMTGSDGYSRASNAVSNFGGNGASSYYGGGGMGGNNAPTAGASGKVNSGSGGGGAGSGVASNAGSGGGAGGYCQKIITSPSSTYSYVLGAGGSGGSAGTSGQAGGGGADGFIIVEEFYQ